MTTDKTSKKLSTTDRKKINRLTTWAEIINKCFKKKEYFVFCFIRWSKGNNFLFCCYRYIATTNIKITEVAPYN